MALLAISLPVGRPTSESFALLEAIQQELPSPEDVCLVIRDLGGEVRLQHSVYVTPRVVGTFWIALVQRLLANEQRAEARTDELVRVLRPGTSTLLVVTRTHVMHAELLTLARSVGGHVTNMPLSRQHEFALHLAGLMPNVARPAA